MSKNGSKKSKFRGGGQDQLKPLYLETTVSETPSTAAPSSTDGALDARSVESSPESDTTNVTNVAAVRHRRNRNIAIMGGISFQSSPWDKDTLSVEEA